MRINLGELQELVSRAAAPVVEYIMYDGYNAALVTKWGNGLIKPVKGSMNLVIEWDNALPSRYEVEPNTWVIMEVIDGKRARVADVIEIDNGCDGLYSLAHWLEEMRSLNAQPRRGDD